MNHRATELDSSVTSSTTSSHSSGTTSRITSSKSWTPTTQSSIQRQAKKIREKLRKDQHAKAEQRKIDKYQKATVMTTTGNESLLELDVSHVQNSLQAMKEMMQGLQAQTANKRISRNKIKRNLSSSSSRRNLFAED